MWVVGAATTTRRTRPVLSIWWATRSPNVVLPAAGVAEARKLGPPWPSSPARAASCQARRGRLAGQGGSACARRSTAMLTVGESFLPGGGKRQARRALGGNCQTRGMARPQAVLFDIDGTLISTGGAGARSWRYAFEELHGIPADIGEFTDAGMTDPTVARLTFKAAVGHEPTARELATVMAAYLDRIPYEVEHSQKYRVLDGAEELLRKLGREQGVLLGITSGAVEAAAHIKLSRAGFNRYFPFGGYGS